MKNSPKSLNSQFANFRFARIHNNHYEKRNNRHVLEFYCLVFVGIRATACFARTVSRETMFTGGNNNTNEVVDSHMGP